jgi:hypothetical protein
MSQLKSIKKMVLVAPLDEPDLYAFSPAALPDRPAAHFWQGV